MRKPMRILLVILINITSAASFVVANEICSYTVKTDQGTISTSGNKAAIEGGDMISIPGAPLLGYRVVKVILPPETRVTGIACGSGVPILLAPGLSIESSPGDVKTDIHSQFMAATPDRGIYGSDSIYPERRAEILSSGYWGDIHLAALAVYPLAYKPLSRQLLFFPEITVNFILSPITSRHDYQALVDPNAYRTLAEDAINPGGLPLMPMPPTGAPQAPFDLPATEYLVITSGALASAFLPFVEWKNEKGVPAELVFVEDILALTDGIDPPEKLRNYLVAAHERGVRWVLLGGDEDNVPIRYLFAGNTSDILPPLAWMQIADLYYADLTGDWDVDGDGVWGETEDDNPDIYPELYIGRIPARNADEVSTWVSKALEYEKNPGNGNPSYLTKALIICSDEMRDLDQHLQASSRIPSDFVVDYQRLIEEPSGGSPFPTQPTGQRVIEVMQEGWGFVTNLSHGDFSYYAALSSGYNTDGRSNVWGDTIQFQNDGAFSHLTNFHTLSIYYSVSCDVAAFDFDRGIFYPGPWLSNHSLAESYLFEPGGGVAFLGYTRWGWVSSSFRMENKFLQRIFVDSTSQLGVAEALSKTDYPNSMDIVYGHNLFGDPEMAMWLEVPGRLSIEGPSSIIAGEPQDLQIHVSDIEGPVADVKVCLYKSGELQAISQTGNSGLAQFDIEVPNAGVVMVTATKLHYIPAQDSIMVELQIGANDEAIAPAALSVSQNYPNPLNSNTTITFNLPKSGIASLSILDICGRRVRMLASRRFDAGVSRINWNGEDDTGGKLASGIYFYRFVFDDKVVVKQMTIVK